MEKLQTERSIKEKFPDVIICNIETRFIQNSMIPRVLVDLVYKDKLKTLTIYLDKEKADALDTDYIENTIKENIRKYIVQFNKNNKN